VLGETNKIQFAGTSDRTRDVEIAGSTMQSLDKATTYVMFEDVILLYFFFGFFVAFSHLDDT
jgi:hypothetical protein